jgi:hypothetical protein
MGNMVVKYKGIVCCVLFVVGLMAGVVFVDTACAAREVLRGAGGGAVKGAAIGELSGGDAGKGAAWGAAAGAARGVANKRRAEQASVAAEENAAKDARIHELEMQQAYEEGRRSANQARNSGAMGR